MSHLLRRFLGDAGNEDDAKHVADKSLGRGSDAMRFDEELKRYIIASTDEEYEAERARILAEEKERKAPPPPKPSKCDKRPHGSGGVVTSGGRILPAVDALKVKAPSAQSTGPFPVGLLPIDPGGSRAAFPVQVPVPIPTPGPVESPMRTDNGKDIARGTDWPEQSTHDHDEPHSLPSSVDRPVHPTRPHIDRKPHMGHDRSHRDTDCPISLGVRSFEEPRDDVTTSRVTLSHQRSTATSQNQHLELREQNHLQRPRAPEAPSPSAALRLSERRSNLLSRQNSRDSYSREAVDPTIPSDAGEQQPSHAVESHVDEMVLPPFRRGRSSNSIISDSSSYVPLSESKRYELKHQVQQTLENPGPSKELTALSARFEKLSRVHKSEKVLANRLGCRPSSVYSLLTSPATSPNRPPRLAMGWSDTQSVGGDSESFTMRRPSMPTNPNLRRQHEPSISTGVLHPEVESLQNSLKEVTAQKEDLQTKYNKLKLDADRYKKKNRNMKVLFDRIATWKSLSEDKLQQRQKQTDNLQNLVQRLLVPMEQKGELDAFIGLLCSMEIDLAATFEEGWKKACHEGRPKET